jgi:hypothetical protein
MFVIPTWRVVTQDSDGQRGRTFRVPETNLDAFLHVLTFNSIEFDVRRERNPLDIAQQTNMPPERKART